MSVNFTVAEMLNAHAQRSRQNRPLSACICLLLIFVRAVINVGTVLACIQCTIARGQRRLHDEESGADMKNIKSIVAGLYLGIASVGLMIAPSHANLMVNGSFESPSVPGGSFSIFTPTTVPGIDGWTVVTPSGGNVIVVDSGLTSGSFSFPAQDGNQSLDLTGDPANLSAGIFQMVTTTIGTRYDLSYYVGNVAGSVLGTISTVDVSVDDVLLTSSTNSTASIAANWQLFTHSFIASTGSTKIAFGNGDGLDDNYNGLDNVVLVAAVPEPDTLAIFGLGLVGLATMRRRRKVV